MTQPSAPPKAGIGATALATLRAFGTLLPWFLLKWILSVATVVAFGLPFWQFLKRQFAAAPADTLVRGGMLRYDALLEILAQFPELPAFFLEAGLPWLVLFVLGNLICTAAFLSALADPHRETFAVTLVRGLTRFPALALLTALFVGAAVTLFQWLGETFLPLLQAPDLRATTDTLVGLQASATFPLVLLLLGLLLMLFDASRVHLFRHYALEQDIPRPLTALWWLVKPLVAVCFAVVAVARRPFSTALMWPLLFAGSVALAGYQQVAAVSAPAPLWLVQVLIGARILVAMMRLSFLNFWFNPRRPDGEVQVAADTGAGAFDGLEQYAEDTPAAAAQAAAP